MVIQELLILVQTAGVITANLLPTAFADDRGLARFFFIT